MGPDLASDRTTAFVAAVKDFRAVAVGEYLSVKKSAAGRVSCCVQLRKRTGVPSQRAAILRALVTRTTMRVANLMLFAIVSKFHIALDVTCQKRNLIGLRTSILRTRIVVGTRK